MVLAVDIVAYELKSEHMQCVFVQPGFPVPGLTCFLESKFHATKSRERTLL